MYVQYIKLEHVQCVRLSKHFDCKLQQNKINFTQHDGQLNIVYLIEMNFIIYTLIKYSVLFCSIVQWTQMQSILVCSFFYSLVLWKNRLSVSGRFHYEVHFCVLNWTQFSFHCSLFIAQSPGFIVKLTGHMLSSEEKHRIKYFSGAHNFRWILQWSTIIVSKIF